SSRINDVERWLVQTHDPARVKRVRDGIARFPPLYQTLIRAGMQPVPGRLALLGTAADQEQQFPLLFMLLGDELFHRGPLYGHLRADAINRFQRTVQLQPRFAPGWEHLAWAEISDGDSAG